MKRPTSLIAGHLACLLVALIAGCAVGPDYNRPALDMPAQWQTEAPWRQANPDDAQPKGPWWRKFDDPDLDALQQKARENNASVAVAMSRLAQTQSAVNAATAALYPQLNANIRASRARISSQRPLNRYDSPQFSTVQNDYIAALGVNYEVDLSGRVRRSIELAQSTTEQSAADLENVRLLVAADLATAYFNLRAVDTEIDVLTRAIGLQRRAQELAAARHELGAASGIDVAQQQALIDATLTQMELLRRQRGVFEHAIATLTGTPAPLFALPVRLGLSPPPTVAIGVPSDLLERRPDVASAERAMAAANAQVGLAHAAYYPSITLGGLYGSDSRAMATLFETPALIWSLGAAIAQPLFDGGRIRANIETSRAAYEAAVANYRRVVLIAMQEAEDGITGLAALERAHGQALAAARSARRVLELATARYEGGLAGYIEVIIAQQALLNNERLVAQITGQRLLTAVFLIKALGGDFEGMKVARDAGPATLAAQPAPIPQ